MAPLARCGSKTDPCGDFKQSSTRIGVPVERSSTSCGFRYIVQRLHKDVLTAKSCMGGGGSAMGVGTLGAVEYCT